MVIANSFDKRNDYQVKDSVAQKDGDRENYEKRTLKLLSEDIGLTYLLFFDARRITRSSILKSILPIAHKGSPDAILVVLLATKAAKCAVDVILLELPLLVLLVSRLVHFDVIRKVVVLPGGEGLLL